MEWRRRRPANLALAPWLRPPHTSRPAANFGAPSERPSWCVVHWIFSWRAPSRSSDTITRFEGVAYRAEFQFVSSNCLPLRKRIWEKSIFLVLDNGNTRFKLILRVNHSNQCGMTFQNPSKLKSNKLIKSSNEKSFRTGIQVLIDFKK